MFDGMGRPVVKCGQKVVQREHIVYQGMIAFIEAFGFWYHIVSIGHFEFEAKRFTMLYLGPCRSRG